MLANKMTVFNFPGTKYLCQKVVNFVECKNEYVAQKLLGSKKNVGMRVVILVTSSHSQSESSISNT